MLGLLRNHDERRDLYGEMLSFVHVLSDEGETRTAGGCHSLCCHSVATLLTVIGKKDRVADGTEMVHEIRLRKRR